VKVLLVCSSLRTETLAAAGQLGPAILDLAVYRCVHTGTEIQILLEPATPVAAPTQGPPADEPESFPVPSFRTGLTDSDLGLSEEEHRDFE
jgi:hypothetical protein